MTPDELEVPEPDGTDPKEVYAFYGLAAYMAQVVEKALVSFLALLQADGLPITRTQYEALFDGLDAKTFGQLLREARKRVPILPGDSDVLAGALKRRNHLAHQFFADRAPDFTTEPGRARMIADLRSFTGEFHRAEQVVAHLTGPLMQKHGLTPETVEVVGAAMVARFLAEHNFAG